MSAKSVIYVSRKLSFSGEVLPGCQVICLQVFSGVKLEALLMVSWNGWIKNWLKSFIFQGRAYSIKHQKKLQPECDMPTTNNLDNLTIMIVESFGLHLTILSSHKSMASGPLSTCSQGTWKYSFGFSNNWDDCGRNRHHDHDDHLMMMMTIWWSRWLSDDHDDHLMLMMTRPAPLVPQQHLQAPVLCATTAGCQVSPEIIISIISIPINIRLSSLW